MSTILITHGLLYGLVLSVLMSTLFITAAYLNPEIMLRSYPPDIKARYGPGRPETKRQRSLASMALLVIMGGTFTSALLTLPEPLTFVTAFICIFVVMFIFNVVDLVIIDWLVFVTLQPRFVVLPGTEGLVGYKDYAFHFKAFLRGMVLCFVVGLIVAGIAALIALV